MQQNLNFDIVIVGGGIVGLSLARSLQLSGLKLALIDGIPTPPVPEQRDLKSPKFDSRVSALTVSSQKIMEALVIWEKILLSHPCHYEEMEVWDREGTGSIYFSAAEIHQPRLGYIIENRVILSALSEAVEDQENLKLFKPDKLIALNPIESTISSDQRQDSEGKYQLQLESGISLTGKLVIGADGGNSKLRELANFTVKQWAYGHEAIVTTVKTEKSHEFTARQVFLPTGPLAFLPLKNPDSAQNSEQYYSSIVWSCQADKAESLMNLTAVEFATQLEKDFESRLGEIQQVDALQAFPLWQKHATDYVQEGLALVGDAAHTIHPLAGQGVNLGLLDIDVLSEIILAAVSRREDFSSHQVLSRYQRKRKADNVGMMLLMEGFKRVFESEDLTLRWIRNMGMSELNRLNLVKNRLMSKAMGL